VPQHFKVHELLSRVELDQLEAFAREPGRTVDECHEWLQAHGFTLSRSAVGSWKREFLLTDSFRASGAAARSLVEAAKEGGAVAISDGGLLQLSQMIFEQMVRMQESGEVDTKSLWALSMSLKNVISGKRHVEKLKGEIADAIAQAQKEAGDGASGETVANKVREILGIAA